MRSLIVMGVTPSVFEFLVSSLTIFLAPTSCSSAESSIVIILSSSGIYWERAFKNVVLPEPVPPDINILYFACVRVCKTPAASGEIDSISISFSMLMGCSGNFLMETAEPPMEIGFKTILTREPSLSLVSTIGEA